MGLENIDKLNTDFMTTEEVEKISDAVQKAAGCMTDINPERVYHVLYVHKLLQYLTKGLRGVKVTYEVCKPYRGMGSVSVVGRKIPFKDHDLFMRAVELADNFEVYPKTNGTVQMNFTFHRLTNFA